MTTKAAACSVDMSQVLLQPGTFHHWCSSLLVSFFFSNRILYRDSRDNQKKKRSGNDNPIQRSDGSGQDGEECFRWRRSGSDQRTMSKLLYAERWLDMTGGGGGRVEYPFFPF